MTRPLLHYLAALFTLTIYGGQVCPYLESLPLLDLAAILVGALGLQYLTHFLFWVPLVDLAPLEHQSRRVLGFVLATFVTGGIALSLFNLAVFDFPLGSGFKLIVGFLALGVFCATDMSLAQSRKIHSRFTQIKPTLEPKQLFVSHRRGLFIFVFSQCTLMIGVFFLLIAKDLDWMIEQSAYLSSLEAKRSILLELFFVGGIALVHLTNLALAYSKNLSQFFNLENQA